MVTQLVPLKELRLDSIIIDSLSLLVLYVTCNDMSVILSICDGTDVKAD